MTQEEFSTLKPGDKVRIVMEKRGEFCNWEEGMDKWLGKAMTVRGIGRTFFRVLYVLMKEDKDEFDGHGGQWLPEMIDCKVEDEPAEANGEVLRKRFLNELTGEKGPFEWSDFGVEFTQRWDEVSLEMVMEAFDRAMEEEE